VIPVRQTRFGAPAGNCFAACIASILELPLSDLPDPDLADKDAWWLTWISWLRERNLTLYVWEVNPDADIPHGYSILATRPPGLPAGYGHAVVAFDGHVVWNPNPGIGDIGQLVEWQALGVIDPARAMVG
jgi:hypothetical protein